MSIDSKRRDGYAFTMFGLGKRILALVALPIGLLLVVPPELLCCAVPAQPALVEFAAGDCCARTATDAAARDCCDGPETAPDSAHQGVSKLLGAGLVAAIPVAQRFASTPQPSPRAARPATDLPPDDLQALHSVLLI